MRKTEMEIQRIIEQSATWIKFGVAAPLFFLASSLLANRFFTVPLEFFLWTSGVLTIVVCFVWWFWALKVIIAMGNMNKHAALDLTEMKNDVKMMASEVKAANHDLYLVMQRYKEIKEQESK